MIRYIFDLSRGFRGRIALNVATGIVRVLTGLGFVALSKRAVDIATGVCEGNMMVCVVGLIGAIVIELICSSIGNSVADIGEAGMKNEIQERLFDRMLNAEWRGREAFHSGDVLTRLTEDCRVAAECICRTIPSLIIASVQFVGAFIFLCHFSLLLAIIVTAIIPLFIMMGKTFFRKSRVLTRRIRGIESRLQEKMQESLRHRILILTFSFAFRTMGELKSLLSLRYSLVRKRSNLTIYSRMAVMAAFQSGYLAAFLWGIDGLRTGVISFGVMTAYLQLAGQIQRPLAELARLFPGLIQSHTAFFRLSEIERIPVEPMSGPSELDDSATATGIRFRDVTFSYRGDGKTVLSNFNHIFLPGSCTAIIGETGVGKSTLLRLILSLLKPQKGDIGLFRRDTDESEKFPVSVATRHNIVYVPQGNSLLSGSIRRNLLMGKPDATEGELLEALHSAAADFVYDLKFGLETPCGENGAGLSEGQAQRIAIARGLLRHGSILLLDEISSSLDEETEILLMQRLAERKREHTILIVTHRTSVLPYCDNVLRLSPNHPPT